MYAGAVPTIEVNVSIKTLNAMLVLSTVLLLAKSGREKPVTGFTHSPLQSGLFV